MKRILLIFFSIQMTITTALSQPSWIKKATKSVFTLKTFSPDGSLIASSNGFFIGNNGEAVSSYSPFKGASRAIIIDAQGNESNVAGILGANEMYDVARFRVDNRKTQPLPVCSNIVPKGSIAWILPYRETKQIPNGPVYNSEIFQDKFAYYTLAIESLEQSAGCPLLNEAGEVFGIFQPSAISNDTLSYALSVIFADSLRISGLSINDPVLRMTQVKKELPDDLKEANLTIYLASSQVDSTAYAELVDDMINKFPNAPDGYVYRAQMAAGAGLFADAEQDMKQALRLSHSKDEIYYSYAQMIYNKEIYQSNVPYENWSMDQALSEVREAVKINPLPTYQLMEADILFAQKRYENAHDIYMKLSNSNIRSADIFYSAAKCKGLLNDTTAMLALMDSCVNTFSRPYLKEAAPYLWERAMLRREAKRYRDALNDMNEYEQLMNTSANDNFYYIRYQTDIQARLYQQALNDIKQAIQLNPQESLYYAEKASLELRVGLYDDTINTANDCITIAPENSDGYLFLGLAQCMKGDKKQGVGNLLKAKELGNPQADELIQKYK